jgi:hypothetical protein
VRSLVAVQSQDYPGATWALAHRLDGWTQAAIDAAFDAGELIRTHVLRPTWHFVAPDDLRWLLALTGPRRIRGAAHRHRALDIDARLATRSIGVFERTIATSGPRTRQELRAALADIGIETDTGRLAHLIIWAEAEAVLCSGPRRGPAHTYALVDERVPPAPDRAADEALAEIAARYVAGHGPAQDVDLAWWSGLNVGEARRGLAAAASDLEREVLEGRTFWSAPVPRTPRRSGPRLHLLPNFDELLVAFRDRSDAIDPGLPAAARTPEAIFSNVLARDGQVVGRWRRSPATAPKAVVVEPLVPLDPGDREALAGAVERYAAYLERPLEMTGLD